MLKSTLHLPLKLIQMTFQERKLIQTCTHSQMISLKQLPGQEANSHPSKMDLGHKLFPKMFLFTLKLMTSQEKKLIQTCTHSQMTSLKQLPGQEANSHPSKTDLDNRFPKIFLSPKRRMLPTTNISPLMFIQLLEIMSHHLLILEKKRHQCPLMNHGTMAALQRELPQLQRQRLLLQQQLQHQLQLLLKQHSL